MEITNAKWIDANQCCISCYINGKHYGVPVDPDNSDYQEIMRFVDAGELTIAGPE